MDAMTNLKRYVRVAGESEDFEIEHSSAQVALRFRPTDQAMRGLRHNSDYIAATVVRACRDITRKPISPIRAEFIHGQPNAKVAYSEFLGCPVKFKAQWDALIFAEETTRLPVKDADDKLLHVLEAAGRRIIGPSPKKRELVHEVRELIVERLPKGTANIDAIAGELNMSSKTLERRLAERNECFSALLDETRYKAAKHYLEETDMPVSQVAYMAGYTESAALTRAFKRWTGATPMQYRDRPRDAAGRPARAP
jgi:AraC-like DNA-binding protein